MLAWECVCEYWLFGHVSGKGGVEAVPPESREQGVQQMPQLHEQHQRRHGHHHVTVHHHVTHVTRLHHQGHRLGTLHTHHPRWVDIETSLRWQQDSRHALDRYNTRNRRTNSQVLSTACLRVGVIGMQSFLNIIFLIFFLPYNFLFVVMMINNQTYSRYR